MKMLASTHCLFVSSISLQSTLDDVDMEEDIKTLVSDEIKKFRKSYQVGVIVWVSPNCFA